MTAITMLSPDRPYRTYSLRCFHSKSRHSQELTLSMVMQKETSHDAPGWENW